MSQYFATVEWNKKTSESFVDNKYSRAHQWKFDGGAIIDASSSPHVVPLPYSCETHVDPEEAFIASISSCHMLFFLSIAAKRRYVIENYTDEATGIMQVDNNKRMSMTDVTLQPKIIFSGDRQPTAQQIDEIHLQAHGQCFIANSVKTKVHIKP